MLGTGRGLDLVWVAGDIIGRMAVASNPFEMNRREKLESIGSSGKRSLMRASSFTICVSSP